MWGVLQCSKAVAKHVVGLSQHWFISTLVYLNIGFLRFLLQELFRESHSKLMACSPTCELHSPHLGCSL